MPCAGILGTDCSIVSPHLRGSVTGRLRRQIVRMRQRPLVMRYGSPPSRRIRSPSGCIALHWRFPLWIVQSSRNESNAPRSIARRTAYPTAQTSAASGGGGGIKPVSGSSDATNACSRQLGLITAAYSGRGKHLPTRCWKVFLLATGRRTTNGRTQRRGKFRGNGRECDGRTARRTPASNDDRGGWGRAAARRGAAQSVGNEHRAGKLPRRCGRSAYEKLEMVDGRRVAIVVDFQVQKLASAIRCDTREAADQEHSRDLQQTEAHSSSAADDLYAHRPQLCELFIYALRCITMLLLLTRAKCI